MTEFSHMPTAGSWHVWSALWRHLEHTGWRSTTVAFGATETDARFIAAAPEMLEALEATGEAIHGRSGMMPSTLRKPSPPSPRPRGKHDERS